MRLLVVAAHPDDETLGAGGTIARRVAEGAEARLVVATRAYPPDWSEDVIAEKAREVAAVSRRLGFAATEVLGLPAAKLDTVPRRELNDAFSRVVDDFQPDVVLAPHYGDAHLDHAIVFDAVLVATRPRPGGPRPRLLAYETVSSSEWTAAIPGRAFLPTSYVDITSTLATKLDALRLYGTELRQAPHPRSIESVENLARRRGYDVGVDAAEAFQLIREAT